MGSWQMYAVLAAVFAGLVPIFGKTGVAGMDSTLATTLRAVVMAAFLALVCGTTGRFTNWAAPGRRELLFVALSGVAGALSWLCYFLALKRGPAIGVVALDRLSVVFAVVFAALFLAEQVSWRTGAGAALIMAGAVLMAYK